MRALDQAPRARPRFLRRPRLASRGGSTTPIPPLAIAAPAGLIVGNVFVFGPATLYRGNAPELRTEFAEVLAVYALPALLTMLVLVAPAFVMRSKLRTAYAALLVSLGVLTWLQGNVVVWDYGVLDGREIPWGKLGSRAVVDVGIWLVVGTAILLSRGAAARIGIILTAALLGVQAVGLAVDWPKTPPSRPLAAEASSLEYSNTFNIVHIVLDAFQSDVFGEVVADEEVARQLDGFVWFRENMAVSPTTILALPAIFAGRLYANDIPLARFYEETIGEQAFYGALVDHGYRVHLHLAGSYRACLGRWTTCHVIAAGRRSDAAMLLDLSLFRHVPQPLKRLIYSDQRWFVQRFAGDRPPAAQHHEFFADYAARVRKGGPTPAYHLVHLFSPHVPVVADERCHYLGATELTRENYRGQAACAVRLLLRFLGRLRHLGVYDSSAIIVQADHGAGFPVVLRPGVADRSVNIPPEVLSGEAIGGALALLAVKPPDRRGRLTVSTAPTAVTDTAATVLAIAGLRSDGPGRSVLEIDPREGRRRLYNFYRWHGPLWNRPFLDPIQRFEVDGSAWDAAAWRLGGVLLAPAPIPSTRRVDLGAAESGSYLLRGWGGSETLPDGTTVAWGLGRSSAVQLALPPDRDVQLTARLLSYPVPGGTQRVTVVVDDAVVGQWDVGLEWRLREFTTVVPRVVPRRPTSLIEFRFGQFKPPAPPGQGDVRPLAVLFDWIAIKPVE